MTMASSPDAILRAFSSWMVLLLMASLSSPAAAEDPVLEVSAPADHPELSIHHPDISPDGRFIAASASSGDFRQSTIWVFDRERGGGRQLTRQDSLMNWGDVCARWSPDGQTILFVSDRGGIHGVYVVDVESAEMRLLREVTGSGAWSIQGDWSPDGSKVVYPDSSAGHQNLFTYRIADGLVEQVTHEASGSPMYPLWSEARSIVFSIDGEKSQFFRIDPVTGAKNLIHSMDSGDFAFPRSSPDGAWLVYQSGLKTYVLPADGGEPVEMKPAEGKRVWGPVWDGATNRLLYHQGEIPVVAVVVHDFEKGTDWEVVSMRESSWGAWASWSPSGDRVAFLADSPDGQTGTKLIVADTESATVSQADADSRENGSSADAPAWISDNVLLHVRRESAGSSDLVSPPPTVSRILALDVATMQVREAVHERNGVIHHVAASHDTELLSYTLENEIWIYDRLDQQAYELMLPDRLGEIQLFQFSPNDDKLLFRGRRVFQLYDLDTGDIDEVPLNKDEQWQAPTAHWINGQELLYAAGGRDRRARIYRYNVDTRQSLYLHGNEEEHCWRPFSVEDGMIFFQEGVWEAPRLMRINTTTGDIQEEIPAAHLSIFARDGSKVIYGRPGETNVQAVLMSQDVSHLMEKSLQSKGPAVLP